MLPHLQSEPLDNSHAMASHLKSLEIKGTLSMHVWAAEILN